MWKKRKWLNSFTVALILTFVSVLIYRFDFQLFHFWELKSYDFKVRSRGVRPITNQVVIVAIDDKSLQEEGRWPWPRTKMAKLIDRLSEAGAAVIGVDFFFVQKDAYVPFQAVKRAIMKMDMAGLSRENMLQLLQEVGDSDKHFAKSIANSGRTVLAFFVHGSEENAEEAAQKMDPLLQELLPFFEYPIVQRFDDPENPVPLRPIYAMGVSLPELTGAANSSGYVSFVPEVDGIVRWVPMVMQYQQGLYPPLSMQILQQATQMPIGVVIAPYGVDGILLGKALIPTSEIGDFLVNYYGPAHTFTHYSATDILSGKTRAEDLQGKIILVGATAIGTHDLHTTPFGPLYPGVEVHATMIENILNSDFLNRPDWFTVLDIAMILGSGLILGIASLYFGAVITSLFLLFGVAGYLIMDFYIFSRMGLWVNTIYPVFTQIFVYTGTTLWKFAYEEKQKRFIQKAFSKYLSPVMVEELVKNPKLLESGGEELVMTVSFSDMKGFTAISESMSYLEISKYMNEYFTEMTAIILEEEGTVTQYAGDLIMAIYGAPIHCPDHAQRSVKVALKMGQRLKELNEIWAKRGLPELGVRTGINTDKMFFGNLGSQQIFYYSVIGDSVNTAARLETANKQYDTSIMISEFTYKKLEDGVFETRILDIIKMKGKTKAMKVYEVYGETGDEMDSEKLKYYHLYEEGFESYLSKDFISARRKFESALLIKPDDKAAIRMVERVIGLDPAKLPDDWDGTFVMTTK